MSEGRPSTGSSLQQLFELGVGAMALLAAHRVGLVRALLERAATPGQYARELGLDPRATALTLNVLGTFGAAAYADGTYRASDELAGLAATSPGGVSLDLDLYAHVGEYLSTGRPLIAMDGTLAERGEHYRQVAAGLGPRYRTAAAALAERLGPGIVDVLDVGAGSGVWSLALAERHPDARVTAIDLPPVLEVFHANAKELGVEHRVSALAGGYLDVAVPAGAFDCVILGNVLHLEPPERAAALVRRAGAALRPGGRAVIVDILGQGGHEPDAEHAMYALFLALRTREGRMYPRAQVLGWVADAGLVEPAELTLPGAPSLLSFVTATRTG